MDLKWEWFCGENSSYMDDSLDWYDDFRNNTCLVNGLATVPHAVFLLLSALILLVVGCFTSYRRVLTKYLLVYPGHSVRWLLLILLLVIVLASIGEGIMTDETYQAWEQPTQPHLYIHSIVAFVAVALSLIYYHHMELWQLPAMSILLFLYWLCLLGTEVLRMFSLEYQKQTVINVLVFDLTVARFAIYLSLAALDVNVIRHKIFCLSEDEALPGDLRQTEMKCMQYNVSFFSAATFWWVNWLTSLGYRKPLELEDLGLLPERHRASSNHQRFRRAYLEEKAKGNTAPSLLKVYVKVYGRRMFLAAFLKVVGEMFAFVGPLAVGALTLYVKTLQFSKDEVTIAAHNVTIGEFFQNGFVLVVVIFLTALVNSLCQQTHFYISIIEGMSVGTALQSMVYEKSLRLSPVAMSSGQLSIGQITNHMSVDVDAVQYMFQNFSFMIISPIQITVNLTLLYSQIGFSGLIGASVFLVAIPLQLILAWYMGKQQKQYMGYSDKRLEKTNELLQQMKLLKMYAWEGLYCKAIEAIRARELGCLGRIKFGTFQTLILAFATPALLTVLTFGTYSFLTGDLLTPDVTFSALSLFNMLALPMFMLPSSLLFVINGVVSTHRVQAFLPAPEIADATDLDLGRGRDGGAGLVTSEQPAFPDKELKEDSFGRSSPILAEECKETEKSLLIIPDARERQGEQIMKTLAHEMSLIGNGVKMKSMLQDGVAIKISSGCFVWDTASDGLVLSDINVEIPEGKLTIVIGQIGSGKSSLLSAILGEMASAAGMVRIRDGYQVAFAAQKPWLLNASLQDNILFSQPMDSQRYQRVIDACALRPDIDILPGGDQTEIGEKGINLSGGQKQRVSVARAMYSGRDIIILDDPLSALDVHVGSHLFNEGIKKFLLGQDKTVVLVTHQLQYLSSADLIIKMEGGRVVAQGTQGDIISAYPEMYSEYDRAVKQASDAETSQDTESLKEDRLILKKQIETVQHQSRAKPTGPDASRWLMEQEEIERGSVSYTVYLYAAQNFGLVPLLITLALSGLYAGLFIGANFWLSDWADFGLRNVSGNTTQLEEYFGVFVALEFSYLLTRLASFAVAIWGLYRMSDRLHQKMLRNIIRAPLRFFDTVPVGRLLNRFSNDTGLIDVKMSLSILRVLISILNMVSAVVVNTIVMPIFIALFLPIAAACFFLQRYFLASSRELQRLNSTSKSPILALLSESLAGLTTIRAYNANNRFYNTLTERIDANVSAFLYLQIVIRWVCVRLDFLGALTVLIAGLVTLIGTFTMGLGPSVVGLAISYTLLVSQFLNTLTGALSDVEMQMNCVERVKYYTHVDNEPYQGEEPPPNWPQTGRIQMEHVSVRYAHNTDTVLRDITVDIKPGQKVGICGRSGAGKSSLTLALLRVIDIFQGRLLIDGVDIKSVPLTTLRRQLSLIPQDPVLFTGSIRMNLDPVSSSDNSDEDLWYALELSQLKDVVSSLDGKLDFTVTEGGENFSVGQRQLFCLARAFLRKSRILIMDEATASIDLETDRVLQKVVETAFAERTVITIAHRITTILNSDVILVLSGGRLVEYGTPDELLEQPEGLFTAFVRDKDT